MTSWHNRGHLAILCRTLGKRCGVAEHAAYLGERLGAVTVASVDELPDDVETVFVQYEPSLYQSDDDILSEIIAVERRAHTVVLDAHVLSPELAEAASWHAIVATRRNFLPGTLQLSLCLPPPVAERQSTPQGLRLGSFGFALPHKRFEDVVALAKRLQIPATILAAHANATPAFDKQSTRYLQTLKKLQEPGIEVIDKFLPMTDVIQRLRQCSHLICFMDDNGWQSASLRAMALAGRPMICTGRRNESIQGLTFVEDASEVTLPFLEACRSLPRVYDGITDYRALLQRLAWADSLAKKIIHDDRIYLEDTRQMERMAWLRDRAGDAAIDVGIGNGWSTNYLRARTGVDIRADRVAYASLRYPHIAFHLADASLQALPGYDTVFMGDIIEHMPFLQAKEMLARWALTEPERILVTTPNAAKQHYDPNIVEALEHVWGPTPEAMAALAPRGFSVKVETTSGEDFLLIEMRRDHW